MYIFIKVYEKNRYRVKMGFMAQLKGSTTQKSLVTYDVNESLPM